VVSLQVSPYCSPFCDEGSRIQPLLGVRHVGYATVEPSVGYVVKISMTVKASAAAGHGGEGGGYCWTDGVAVRKGFLGA
jgi:hypothetical protein